MGVQSAIPLLLVVATFGNVVAQTAYPVLNITKGAALPTLQTLQPDASGWITLSMLPATIQGPGDNTSADDPYIMYTGRTYNEALVAGMIRIEQGETLRLKVCNELPAYLPDAIGALNDSFATPIAPLAEGGINVYKDINILANHLHGFYGNPGNENIACDPLPDNSSDCYRGDNIFADIPPGSCNYYQYDFADVTSPGALWIHPHHHGSSSLMTHTATVPVIVDVNPDGGFDPLGSASCANMQQFFPADDSNEIILHFQTFMLAVFTEESQNVQNETGPIDDGFIANAVGSLPSDPLCCAGPEPLDDGTMSTTWDNTGDTGPDSGNSSSLLPFYTSGSNALFSTINGAYQPVINMDPGCVMGLYSRDANILNQIPRLTDNIVFAAANRVEVLVQCDAGSYQLQSGQGEFGTLDPGCASSHCDLIQQPIMATVEVDMCTLMNTYTSAYCELAHTEHTLHGTPAHTKHTLHDPISCVTPRGVPYRNGSLNATYKNEIVPGGTSGLLNFTNPQVPGPDSGACSLNGMVYQDFNAMQEVIGQLHELSLWNINVHPYHHHTQPFQIVDLPGAIDSDANNGSWRIGDWADTLELPNIGLQAIVRWIPGPLEITGTGYAVLHCHILPHEDEGCMMKTQILSKEWAPEPKPTGAASQGGKAGITLAVLFVFVAAVVVPVMMWKQKKRRRAAAQAEAEALVNNEVVATDNANHEV
ncbi:MAG: hypothetical protein FRX49_07450 [Trebouxia sp. A1-2]|nr:MAG: hypothetical protein FRX49_07450 [Trebouxia sp. A1-2]